MIDIHATLGKQSPLTLESFTSSIQITENKMKTFAIILATLTLGTLGSLRAADVTGKWKAEFDTQIGHLKYTYDLRADGPKLTGKAFRDRNGEKMEIEIKEGKVSGDAVSFVENVKFGDQEIRIEYSGKLSGDEIKFPRKVADFATTEIVAKREKAAPPAVAGRWQAEFDTQVGKQKYIYEFKVNGDKLTGKAIEDIAGTKSESEIKEGKINGAEISFVERVKFQEQEIRVDYQGKIAGDEIKFTRTVAESIREEIVAKRVKEANAK